jgi:predicted glycosyltransferase
VKVAIYLKHDETLGEVVRVRSIARHLARHGHDVLLLHGGKPTAALAVEPGIRLVQLPSPYDDRYSLRFKVYHPVTADTLRVRVRAMMEAVRSFQPDVLITVAFPFSYEDGAYELTPFLAWLRKELPGTRLVSSLGYPLAEVRPEKLRAMLPAYDLVLVHCPRELDYEYIRRTQPGDAICAALAQLETEGQAVFTNYILPEESRTYDPAGRGDFLLVSRGAGIMHDALIPAAAGAARALGMPCTAVLGASSETPLPAAGPETGFVRHLDQAAFTQALHDCRASVSMAGYGTAVQLLWLRKAASVLVPKDIDTEQDYRAAMLHDLLGSVVLRPETLNTDALAAALREVLASDGTPRVPIRDEWFSGLASVERALAACLSRPPMAVSTSS